MRRYARWPLLVIATLEATLFLLAVYFEPTYCVRGRIRGEATFQGRPTSYWRQELMRWRVYGYAARPHRLSGERLGTVALYLRETSWFEQQRERWRPADELKISYLDIQGPSILYRGEPAEAVLRELLNDPSPRIRLFAQIGLRMNPEIPREE